MDIDISILQHIHIIIIYLVIIGLMLIDKKIFHLANRLDIGWTEVLIIIIHITNIIILLIISLDRLPIIIVINISVDIAGGMLIILICIILKRNLMYI